MCHTSVTKAYVALGANLPSRYGAAHATLQAAIAALDDVTSSASSVSGLYRTPAFPAGSGPDFVNAVVGFSWTGTASELLDQTQAIEARFGRTRSKRWEARVLDLDILALGRQVLPDPETEAHWRGLSPKDAQAQAPDTLILPHPRMAERGFVLVPFMDVAPDWVHPVLGQSVRQMCAALPAAERAEIVPL